MPTNTAKLNLRKIDIATDGNLNVNVETDFNQNWDKIDAYAQQKDNEIGALPNLATTEKTNLVGAVNELFTNVSNGKSVVATAITGKGVPASGSDTFQQLADKVSSIQLATGDAAAGDVLSGKTFSNANTTGATGTMPNRGAVTITPSVSNQAIPAGYHNGSGVVSGVSVPAANVLTGTTIAGTAGTMPNRGAVAITPGTTNQTIAAGYHNGSGYVAGDPDLIAANIRKGTNIFGVVGSTLEFGAGSLMNIDRARLGDSQKINISAPSSADTAVHRYVAACANRFFHMSGLTLIGRDSAGNQIWTKAMATGANYMICTHDSQFLYVQDGTTLYKLRTSDGGQVWAVILRYQITDPRCMDVDGAGNFYYIGNASGIAKLDQANGAQLWLNTDINSSMKSLVVTPNGSYVYAIQNSSSATVVYRHAGSNGARTNYTIANSTNISSLACTNTTVMLVRDNSGAYSIDFYDVNLALLTSERDINSGCYDVRMDPGVGLAYCATSSLGIYIIDMVSRRKIYQLYPPNVGGATTFYCLGVDFSTGAVAAGAFSGSTTYSTLNALQYTLN